MEDKGKRVDSVNELKEREKSESLEGSTGPEVHPAGQDQHDQEKGRKDEDEEATSIDMQRTAKYAKAVPSPGGGAGGSGPLDNHLTSKLANFSLRQPLHLEREAKVMHTDEVKIRWLRFAPWFQVWSKPDYSSSSSSSETSPTCPIVPWDPASMTPLKVKVKTGKK